MVRDNDLVREILLKVEASEESPLTIGDLGIADWDSNVVGYHLQLLQEAGYISATFAYADNVVYQALINRLTWEGHDFLDAVRSDTVWAKTKSKLAESVGTAPLEVVKAVASAVALKALGL